MKFIIVLTLLISNTVLADSLVLDPNRTSCVITPAKYDYQSVNLTYDGKIIHVGRAHNEPVINGDMIKCQTIINSAKSEKTNLIMSRDYNSQFNMKKDWYNDDFLTLANGKFCF